MTVQITIPSSEAPEREGFEASGHPRPRARPLALVAGTCAIVFVLAGLAMSVSEPDRTEEAAVPPPFPIESGPERDGLSPMTWVPGHFPGAGGVLAAGMVGDEPVAVALDAGGPVIWRRNADVWTIADAVDVEAFTAAAVSDDRVFIVGALNGNPVVWEWLPGSLRVVFQTVGDSITNVASVGRRIAITTSSSDPGDDVSAIRFQRQDQIWVETSDGEFVQVDTFGPVTVLSVSGAYGPITIAGMDADGDPFVGFVNDDKLLSSPRLPSDADRAGIVDVAPGLGGFVALISTVGRDGSVNSAVRVGEREWAVVAEGEDLIDVEVVDGRIIALRSDGTVLDLGFDGSRRPALSARWSFGDVAGLTVIDEAPVIYGRLSGLPTLSGQKRPIQNFDLPVGSWERYHDEAAAGYRLIGIGALEFGIRDDQLFSRAWNADRWHPATFDEDVALFGSPVITQLDWGYLLNPGAGPGLWSSRDGASWTRAPGTADLRVVDDVTNGEVYLGMTHGGGGLGPTTVVSVVDQSGLIDRIPLGYRIGSPFWNDELGFVATVRPPNLGYAHSADGIVWNHVEEGVRYDIVSQHAGEVYRSSGESVVEGGSAVESPTESGRLLTDSGVVFWASDEDANWISVGDQWRRIQFGAISGLPSPPTRIEVYGGGVFAYVESIEGSNEVYRLSDD